MKLSEIRQVLAANDIRLTKSLGQNFLHDANQLRRIAETAELTNADKVLEIGPGLGPLTELLVEQAGEVLAIEKDGRLVEVLQERFLPRQESRSQHLPAAVGSETRTSAALRLIQDDALDYLKRERRDWSGWKLVANLPYSVASPILVELALVNCGPQRFVVTLQIDVARRLMTKPGDKDYGVLTLLVQLNYEPQCWFKIPAGCFFPEPEVDSACVCLVRRDRTKLTSEQTETFTRIVKRAFSQRRKMMLKLLREDWQAHDLERAFAATRLSPRARAEVASLEQFVDLTRLLHGGQAISRASTR